jgi:transposase
MEITAKQLSRIAAHLPKQRGNVSHETLNVINAILYVAESGCKWRALPKRFGNWHTIYTRMNRWAKAGVLDRVFAELERQNLIRIGPGTELPRPLAAEGDRELSGGPQGSDRRYWRSIAPGAR